MNHDDTIHVAYALDDNYTMFTCVSMTSLLHNTARPVHFHVLENKLSEENKQILRDIGKKYPYGTWTFYHVDSSDSFVIDSKTTLTVETYFRVFLPSLLPDYEKVLWIDGDTVVHGDISELFDIDVSGYCIAGCLEPNVIGGCAKMPEQIKHGYFNAGVLLFNIAEILNQKIDLIAEVNKRAPLLIQNYLSNHFIYYGDQECFNFIFKNKIKLLPPRFNFEYQFRLNKNCFTLEEQKQAFLSPVIIHFWGQVLRNINKLKIPSYNPYWELWYKYKKLTSFYTSNDDKKMTEYHKRMENLENSFVTDSYKEIVRWKEYNNVAAQLKVVKKRIAVWGYNDFVRYLIAILACHDVEVHMIVDGMPKNYFEEVYEFSVKSTEELIGKSDEYHVLLNMQSKEVADKVKEMCKQYGYSDSDCTWVYDSLYKEND